MKKFIILIIPFILFSCNMGFNIEEAEKTVNSFHHDLKNNQFEKIIENQISSDGLAVSSDEEWLGLFRILDEYGGIKKVEKEMGFKSNITNGIHTVRYRYHFTLNDGKDLYENIELIKENDHFMVNSLYWNENKSNLPEL